MSNTAATFLLSKPIAPPSSLTHAVHAHLLSPDSDDVVCVRGGCFLEILSLDAEEAWRPTTLDAVMQAGGLTNKHTLRRRQEARMFGNVQGICVVRLPNWTRDALLITYPHAKLALVAWDMGRMELMTMCIWSQDEEIVERERERERLAHVAAATAAPPKTLAGQLLTQMKKYVEPVLRVDTTGRCAALVTFDAFLNIFDLSAQSAAKTEQGAAVQVGLSTSATGATSFHASAAASSLFSSTEGVGSIPALSNPTVYSLSALALGAITDMQWLHGFAEPTLLVLHERHRTWEGRLAAKRLTQDLTAITFHLSASGSSFSTIGNVSGVSHDAFSILPLPMPHGGAVLLAQNVIWHWNNNSLDFALTLNELARTDKVAQVEDAVHVMQLDGARAVVLSCFSERVQMLLSTAGGETFLLTVNSRASGKRKLELDALAMLPPNLEGMLRIANPRAVSLAMPSFSMTTGGNQAAADLPSLVFAFSRSSPAILIEYRRANMADGATMLKEEKEENEVTMRERQATIAQEAAAREQTALAAAAASASANGTATGSQAMEVDGVATASAPTHPTTTGPDELPPALAAATESSDASEPAAKRSKLEELYAEIPADDFMAALGFVAGAQGKEEVQEKKKALTAAELFAQETAEAKKAEVSAVKVAADKESVRRRDLARAFGQRSVRKDLMFFVRDAIACVAPTQDVLAGYAQPLMPLSEEEETARQQADAARDQLVLKHSVEDAKKAANDDEERAQALKERQDTDALDRLWRTKERHSRVVELTSVAGSDAAGCIAVRHEGVLPDVSAAVPHAMRVVGCWALREKRKRFHTLVIYSTHAITHAYRKVDDNLQPLVDVSALGLSAGRTVAAGNVQARGAEGKDDAEGIVQASRTGVRLVQNGALVREWSIPQAQKALSIDAAQVESPHVLLRLSDHSLRLLTVTAASSSTLALSDAAPVDLPDAGAVSSAFLFRDTSAHRWLRSLRSVKRQPTERGDGERKSEDDDMEVLLSKPTAAASASSDANDIDDLERLLGGGPAPVASAAETKSAVATTAVVPPDEYLVVAQADRVDFLLMDNGLTLVYSIQRFALGERVQSYSQGAPDALSLPLPASALPAVVDLCVDVADDALTLYSLLDNGDVLVYEAFESIAPRELRWLKQDAPITRPFLNTKAAPGALAAASEESKTYREAFGIAPALHRPVGLPSRFQRLPHLENVDSAPRSAVLLSGTRPFLFVRERGRLRAHAFIVETKPREDDAAASANLEDEEDVEADEDEHTADDAEAAADPSAKRKQGLLCVTPLHYHQLPHAMLYFDSHGTMHMAKLPPVGRLPKHPLWLTERKRASFGLVAPLATALHSTSTLSSFISLSQTGAYSFDGPLVSRYIHLGATPCFVARHPPTGTTAIVLSYPQRVPAIEMETERTLPIYDRRYELVFFNDSWDEVARYSDFEPHEMVLCMSAIRMNRKLYIVMGTTDYQSEDHSTRGRIILVEPSFGRGQATLDAAGHAQEVTLFRLKAYTQSEKLPVTHVTQLSHNLLCTAQGSKIIFYKHTGSQLAGCAFFDAQMFISSVTCLNHFVLYGDVRRGVHLLYYDPVLRTLTQLGQSNEHFHVTACDFFVDLKNLNLAAADEQGNVQLFKFSPNTPAQAANRVQLASYENPHVSVHPGTTQTLKENVFSGTSLLGGSGYKLNLKNDFHLGEKIARMIKFKLRTRPTAGAPAVSVMPSSDGKLARQISASSVNVRPLQSYLLLSSFSGSTSQLLPIDPMIFRRLSTLALQMSAQLHQIGGLNPIAYRLFQSSGSHHPHFAKKVLDLTLLLQFPALSAADQWRMAKQIGTTPAQVCENIKWILWSTQGY